jgi:hypothetical protein
MSFDGSLSIRAPGAGGEGPAEPSDFPTSWRRRAKGGVSDGVEVPAVDSVDQRRDPGGPGSCRPGRGGSADAAGSLGEW